MYRYEEQLSKRGSVYATFWLFVSAKQIVSQPQLVLFWVRPASMARYRKNQELREITGNLA